MRRSRHAVRTEIHVPLCHACTAPWDGLMGCLRSLRPELVGVFNRGGPAAGTMARGGAALLMPSLLSAAAEGAGVTLRTGVSVRAAIRALCCVAEPAEVLSGLLCIMQRCLAWSSSVPKLIHAFGAELSLWG